MGPLARDGKPLVPTAFRVRTGPYIICTNNRLESDAPVVRQLQALEVSVQPVAKIPLNAERHAPGHESPRNAEPEPCQSGHHDRHGQGGERVALVRFDRVDGPSGQERDQDGRAYRAEREHERPDDGNPVRA